MQSVFDRTVRGAFAGFVATGPMTLLMEALHAALPRERRPLPQHLITERLLQNAGVADEYSRETKRAAGMAAHFCYGTMAGGVYGALAPYVPLPPALKGTLYAVGVGLDSYLGWLPLAGLYRSAVKESPQRNLMLLAAHVVYGAVLGLMTDWLSPPQDDARTPGRIRSAS